MIVINIDYLRYFVVVAKHLSFSKAAKHLYIAQSGVSQGIAKLEIELGFKLFERNRRTVRLTYAGSIFLEDAQEIVNKVDAAIEKGRWADAHWEGTLSLGFLPSLGKIFLPHWISNFRQKCPNIDLKVEQNTMGTLHPALSTGKLDIGYTRSFSFLNEPGFHFKTISTDNAVVVLLNNHPLADNDSVDLVELANEDFIIISEYESPPWHHYTQQMFAHRGFTPRIVARPERNEGIFTLVEAGLGIGLIPSSSCTWDLPNLKYIDVLGKDAHFDNVLAWKATNTNPAIKMFLNIIDLNHSSLP